MFNESGDAYLVDFGIVKTPLEASSFTSAPTAANTSPGTIEYMPPEVLAGEVDAISGLGDQYALPVTLYEMIAGERPFTGPTETAIYRAIEKGAKPLVEVRPGIPSVASGVVSRALNSDPSQRFGTCREFASAFVAGLQSAEGRGPVTSTPDLEDNTSRDSDGGTRELDLEEYRKNLNKKVPGSGSSGRESGGKLFPKPPAATPQVVEGPAIVKAPPKPLIDGSETTNVSTFFPPVESQENAHKNQLPELSHHRLWLIGLLIAMFVANVVGVYVMPF